jgi:hypothetical protein
VTLPLVGILAGHADDSAVAPLIVALRSWCRPHASDPNLGRPVAYLATSPAAFGLDGALSGPEPVVVIAEEPSLVTEDLESRVAGIIVRDARAADAIGDRAILWGRDAVLAAEHPSLSPFVRERWRERLGLPSPLVVEFGASAPSQIDDVTAPSALAVCSAAVVRGPWLVTALALGAAVVTDAASAAHIGATASVHVAVTGPHDARAVAEELAADPARAAALGWGGRMLVEERHDLGTVAIEVVSVLGIGPLHFPDAPLARFDAELDALGTPTTSSVANRALRRVAAIAGPADWTDLTGRRR